jgi:hypothetical protein
MRCSTSLALFGTAVVLAACHGEPAAPTMTEPALFVGGSPTHAIDLLPVIGTGFGKVNVTPTAEDQGTFHVQGEVFIDGASPNTTYFVQRAPDLNVADPTCTGPWISFPTPNPGPLVALTTSPAGAGAAHFELGVGGAFTSGTPFNVRFRVIDDLAYPTSVLMSNCITVVVK